MNVCDGSWSAGLLHGDGFSLPAPAGSTAFGVRPEHLRIVSADATGGELAPRVGEMEPAGAFRIPGRVVVSERLGADRSVYVETPAGVFAVRVGAERGVVAGGSLVSVEASPSSLVFFGADGGLLPSIRPTAMI
jgi:multiple sugar transport system ATP-binding protein